MIDINIIRENPEKVKEALKKKLWDTDFTELLSWDKQKRDLIQLVEGNKAEMNRLSASVPQLKKEGKDPSEIFKKVKEIAAKNAENDAKVKELEAKKDNLIEIIDFNKIDKMLEIYHECLHFEWHYMFYLLQAMYTNDLRQIKKTRSVKWASKKKADALSWLEFQAVHGSFAVWMPTPFMKKQLETRSAQVSGMHPGAQYEHICMGIANEYKIPPFRVRARIVRMGIIEARGACNYLDDHFIQLA